MQRREFINWAGIGFLASYFPLALAACSAQNNQNNNAAETNSTTTDTGKFLSLGTAQQLKEAGFLLNKKSNIIVVRDESLGLVAVNSLCPHRQCTVEWRKDNKDLFCPCHDSKFALDGKVIKGPANRPLGVYEVQEQDGEILVKVS